jgi:hypothetical protein
MARRTDLDEQLREVLPTWSMFAPLVEALELPRSNTRQSQSLENIPTLSVYRTCYVRRSQLLSQKLRHAKPKTSEYSMFGEC